MANNFRVNLPFLKRITSIGTINIAPNSIYLYSLCYNCTAAGTTWGLTIQDRSTPTPIVLYTLGSLVVSTVPVVVLNLASPIPLIGGLDLVLTGTPGGLNVWGNYSQN